MKRFAMIIVIMAMLIAVSTTASAGDFDWFRDFNLQAQVDPGGLRARLATRFQVGDAQIGAVLGNVTDPADAYMVFRLGEMSHYPPEKVMDIYKANKGKGWGVIAKDLGIKPGSSEFHALKRGHDLDRDGSRGKKASKSKQKSGEKGKAENADKNKKKGKNK
jgi:hypothetical protein